MNKLIDQSIENMIIEESINPLGDKRKPMDRKYITNKYKSISRDVNE